jgi:hypothetical protein
VPFERELEIHDPFIIPDELELEHELKRPKWWYAQQLRLAGAQWDEIATALGYQTGATAHTVVKREIGKVQANKQTRQEMLDLELERLDMLQLVVWRRARQGDLKAIEAVLKIMATRHKLLGMGESIYEDETKDKNTILIGGDTEEYIAALKRAQRQTIEGQVA